jgi:hypothetical protein
MTVNIPNEYSCSRPNPTVIIVIWYCDNSRLSQNHDVCVSESLRHGALQNMCTHDRGMNKDLESTDIVASDGRRLPP